MEDVWGYVIDGLFVVFLVSIISGIAASASSFNALLFAMFGGTAEQTLAGVSYTWKGNLTASIGKGAEVLYRTTDASSQVYPLATYITIFALFIGAVLGIVVYAMRLITGARVVAVPVKAA